MDSEPFKSLQFHLDTPGKGSLFKLSRWARILGVINVILGGFNGTFAIPLLFAGEGMGAIAVPSLIMAGILIYMGLQLTSASSNLQFAVINESDRGFSDALEKIQKFFFLSATLCLIGIIFLLMMVFGMVSGSAFPELSPEDPSVISI